LLNRIDKKEAKEANKEDADEWRRVMKSEATGETSLAELDWTRYATVWWGAVANGYIVKKKITIGIIQCKKNTRRDRLKCKKKFV